VCTGYDIAFEVVLELDADFGGSGVALVDELLLLWEVRIGLSLSHVLLVPVLQTARDQLLPGQDRGLSVYAYLRQHAASSCFTTNSRGPFPGPLLDVYDGLRLGPSK